MRTALLEFTLQRVRENTLKRELQRQRAVHLVRGTVLPEIENFSGSALQSFAVVG